MDVQTVMTWLEICGKNDDCSGCCPYGNDGETFDCRQKLMTDAYELMRATYAVRPLRSVNGFICGKCGHVLLKNTDKHVEMPDKCDECGTYVGRWVFVNV